jgi:ubiquinone/menaquinone biosynthesis C-methylase UbiE
MMEAEKMYDPVAKFYDVIHQGLTGDIPFYIEEAKKTKGKVLELASGTGRVTLEMVRAGIDITGLEMSESMLNVARAKSETLPQNVRERITWVQGDMRNFDLKRKFSLIFIPFRSFQHLTNRTDQEACLACVLKHLEKDGLFILSLFAPSYQRLANMQMFNSLGTIELPAGEKLCRTERVTHDHVNQIIYVQQIIDKVDAQGSIRRTIWNFPVRYLWRFEAELLLEKAGLEVETIYGDYSHRAFDHNGEMLFVVRKSCPEPW